MTKLHIITPVKDSFETILKTIESVSNSEISADFNYTVYNDFSNEETTALLESASKKYGFDLLNLKDITMHPSPNYLLVLQIAQQKAIYEGAHLITIESDIVVKKDTIQQLYNQAESLSKAGMIAAVTTNESGKINYPYIYAKRYSSKAVNTRKHISFCCTLMTQTFLATFNFDQLNPETTWYDTFISRKSINLGFKNYLITSLTVLHLPHYDRAWKELKYTNPFKYYWKKLTEKSI